MLSFRVRILTKVFEWWSERRRWNDNTSY